MENISSLETWDIPTSVDVDTLKTVVRFIEQRNYSINQGMIDSGYGDRYKERRAECRSLIVHLEEMIEELSQ